MVIQTPRIPTERTSSKKNKKEKVQPRSFIIYLHWPIKIFNPEHFTLQTNTEIIINKQEQAILMDKKLQLFQTLNLDKKWILNA